MVVGLGCANERLRSHVSGDVSVEILSSSPQEPRNSLETACYDRGTTEAVFVIKTIWFLYDGAPQPKTVGK